MSLLEYHQKKTRQLWEALLPYHQLWNCEVIESYQQQLDFKELREIEFMDDGQIAHSLSKRHPLKSKKLQRINQLITLPKRFNSPSSETLLGLSPKKQYEFKSLVKLFRLTTFSEYYDLGSGKGGFANYLTQKININAKCVDLNDAFQMYGKKEFNNSKLLYIKQEIQNLNFLPAKENLVLTLHGCGDLSGCLGESFIERRKQGHNDQFITISCCYHKIEHFSPKSQIGKELGLSFSREALTLASKGKSLYQPHDIPQTRKLKSFRYTLFLIEKKYGLPLSRSIGNVHSRDLHGCFSSWCKKYASHLFNEFNSKKLDEIFTANSNQEKLQRLLNLDWFRLYFARPIEILIVLDRVLQMQEAGLTPIVYEIFDSKISPRNLAIVKL